MCKKQKVGIITYHSAINYGALLQAYALNTFVNKCGAECETIDYACDAVDIQYKFRGRNRCTSWKNFAAHNLTCLLHMRKKKNMIRFRKRFPQSPECTKEELSRVSEKYDVLITGSDQVFNPDCHRDDSSYYLDFSVNCHKYAYAASLGAISSFEKSKLDVDKLLRDFAGLSFREKEAAEYMNSRLDRDCSTVVDPVWLLSAEEWGQIAESKTTHPYIFVYNLMDYPYMRSFVKRLKKKTGLQVIVVNRTIMGDAAYAGWCRNASNCSPGEFLGYIRGAEYVVTDSFHGTSFSILFGKKFFSAANPKKENTNSRLSFVLGHTGLSDCFISPDEFFKHVSDEKYTSASKKMDSIIAASKAYLKTMLS